MNQKRKKTTNYLKNKIKLNRNKRTKQFKETSWLGYIV